MPFRSMFHSRTISIYAFTLVLTACMLFSVAPATQSFTSLQQERGGRRQIMIDKVHADHWVIHYSYGNNCPAEERDNDAALTAAVTESLQTWLQPLREYTDRPIVNDFRYKKSDDWDVADFGITFHCDIGGGSHAHVLPDETPGIIMQKGIQVVEHFMATLLHEMGHIFGLADTYTREDRDERWLSKGGLDSTRGTQPASMMSGSSWHRDGIPKLGRDDKNGIIWLYKVVHEGLSIRDCFFSDYELENLPLGCVPKRPLIFELKHGIEVRVLRMLKQDKNLDLNARDASGFTALYHAVQQGSVEIVKALLGQPGIKVNLLNTHKRTPAQLARTLKHTQLAKMIEAHPSSKHPPIAWDVAPKGKLTTTWGHLKKRY